MRVITHNQVTMVENFRTENPALPGFTFKAGDSIIALNEWALDALIAIAIAWSVDESDELGESMAELKNLILLEVL